ncbi:transposase [Cohnella sp. GCM10012308]|uniref:transposase n=1 Tax=Cohnella sp. GCM10012308 TaxID=3317329 RepID=UPI00360662DB
MNRFIFPEGSWENWTEAQCVEALFNARWPDGFRCPRCSYAHCSVIRSRKYPLYVCASCRHQTSATAGTVFHGTRTPLRMWFRAMIWLVEEATSVELSDILGVTYKTAWLIGHKLRDALTQEANEQHLSGIVAVTGGIYGWRRASSSLIMEPADQPIAIGGTMEGDEEIREVKMEHLDKRESGNSRLISRIAHMKFSDFHVSDDVKAVRAFSYFGMNKLAPLSAVLMRALRWLDHTLQGIGPKHLQAYLNHQSFVFNIAKKAKKIVPYMLRLCAIRKRITYRELIWSR